MRETYYGVPWRLFLTEDIVYHSVLERLLGSHPVIAVGIGEDLIERLPGTLGNNLTELRAGLLNLLSGNEDV